MALIHYAKNRDFEFLNEPSTESSAPSLEDVIGFAAKHGLILGAYRVNDPREIEKNVSFPLFLVLNEEGKSHMVYLTGHQGERFLVMDPSRGKRIIDRLEMLTLFSGVFLEVTEIKKVDFKAKKPILMPKLTRLALSLMQVSSFSSLIAGFYFINDDGNFLMPLILFAIFALFSIVQRAMTVRAMDRFDDRHLGFVDSLPLENREDAYRHYISFKTAIFSGAPAIIGGALEIAALSVLFAMNEPWIGLAVVSIFILLGIEKLALGTKVREKEKNLEKTERGFLGGYWPKEYRRPLGRDVAKSAIRIADYLAYRRTVIFAVELVFSLLCVLLSGRVSLNYLLFSLAGIAILSEEFEKLIAILEKRNEFEKEKAYFIGHFLNDP